MELQDIAKGEFVEVTKQEFEKVMKQVGSEAFQKQYDRFFHPSRKNGYYIHIGDISSDGMLQALGCYVLVVGNIKAKFVNVCDPMKSESGEFIVIGNIECDYFTNWFGKTVFIDGNLKVNKVASVGQDDSATQIFKDLQAEFYHSSNGWADVAGKASLKYGLGYTLPFEYEDAEEEATEPQHSEEESAAFLGTTVEEIEDGDFMIELFANIN